MKKRIITILLSLAMMVTMMPVMTVAACTESDWDLLAKALAYDENQKSVCGLFKIEDELYFRTVNLKKNFNAKNHDLNIAENVFLDLNNHTLKNLGAINNDGVIIAHKKNASFLNYLINNVTGCYAVEGDLTYPSAKSPQYVIPDGTFMSTEVGSNPAYCSIGFAVGEGPLVWNADIMPGTQLDATYNLTLGGDLLVTKRGKAKTTKVTANFLSLNDNITIGSNNSGDSAAVLSIESIHDKLSGDTIGTFSANGKKITLKRTGKVVVSSDVKFDKSVLICGVNGSKICTKRNKKAKTVTYYVGK